MLQKYSIVPTKIHVNSTTTTICRGIVSLGLIWGSSWTRPPIPHGINWLNLDTELHTELNFYHSFATVTHGNPNLRYLGFPPQNSAEHNFVLQPSYHDESCILLHLFMKNIVMIQCMLLLKVISHEVIDDGLIIPSFRMRSKLSGFVLRPLLYQDPRSKSMVTISDDVPLSSIALFHPYI